MPTVPPGVGAGIILALVEALPRLPSVVYRDLKSSFQNPIEVAARSPTALTMVLLLSGVIEFSETSEWIVQHYRALIRVCWDEISHVLNVRVDQSDRYALTFLFMLALPALFRAVRTKGKSDLADKAEIQQSVDRFAGELNESASYAVKMREFTRAAFRPFAPYVLSYFIAIAFIWTVAFRSAETAHMSGWVVGIVLIGTALSALFYRATWQTLACLITLIAFNYGSLLFHWIASRAG